jgi:hypothetical protein
MNAMFPPRVFRCLVLLAIGVGCLPLFAAPAFAGDTAASGSFLQASFIYELVSDRARLVQVSLVIVAFGCAIMWWYR